MTRGHDARVGEPRPFGVRLDTLRGELAWAGGPPLTSVARRLALWWPGGAWVYAWPVAIELPEGYGRRRSRRIGAGRARGSGVLAALGLIACAAGLARLNARHDERRGAV